MADLTDLINADSEYSSALHTLDSYLEHLQSDKCEGDVAFTVGLSAVVIASAVRSLAVRLDYVLRDIASRWGDRHG